MVLRILNAVSFLAIVLLNFLAVALPLNGKSTGELSDQYPNLFVPAGITFSIWGIIYLLLLVFCVVQFFERYRKIVDAIGFLFIINALLNCSWIVTWHFEYISISVLIMLGLLATLIRTNQRLKNQNSAPIQLAFGVYQGWIMVATIANITAWLVSYHWSGWGVPELYWTILLIIVAAIITGIAVIKLENSSIALSVIWAFTGIAIKRQYDFPVLVWLTSILSLIVAVVAIKNWMKNRKINSLIQDM